MENKIITQAHGSGGKEMDELINSLNIKNRGRWTHYDDDGALLKISDRHKLVFTTDSFTVDPIFFPGGDIGHLAFCGTVNDLCVMGATPLGLSLSMIIEEGFFKNDLDKIMKSINKLSVETDIPIVTGDTKVMQRGKIDKIIINVTGIGYVREEEVLDKKITAGDKVIISGGLGEHAISLLSKRFDYETSIVTDSKPLVNELRNVKEYIKLAKDPTRGGIAAVLNEIVSKNNIGIEIEEDLIPAKDEVKQVVEMLGIDLYQLACEGRFVCIASNKKAQNVVNRLKMFNRDACIIGTVTKKNRVIINTFLGKRILPPPSGNIVPRIC